MSKRNGRKNDEMVLIIINILIAVVSFFTFILGNITIAFGEKFNSGLYVLFGYIIIFVPIIVSIIFNIVMAFVKTGRTIKNNFLNFLTIIIINVIPYFVAYLICWREG